MPGGNTPVSNLPYVLLADVPDANSLSQGLATALDHVVIPKYPSTAARDAANVTPAEGDPCYVTGSGFYFYSGSAWIGPTSALSGAIKSHTSVWTTTSGLHTPSIGNGNITFKYSVLGKIVFFNFDLTAGTTTNYNSGTGTDNWQWTLPVAADTGAYNQTAMFTLMQSTGLDCQGRLILQDSTHFAISIDSGRSDGTGITNLGNVDTISPWTWASNSSNHIRGGGHYIAA